jgi:hypothetical protein
MERREDRKAARRYDRAVMAPPSPEAAAYIRKRLQDGTAPVRRIRRRECSASRSGLCLNNVEGFEPCDVDEGECIHRNFQKP